MKAIDNLTLQLNKNIKILETRQAGVVTCYNQLASTQKQPKAVDT